MANIFQPNLETEARFDQPVDQPSVLGAVFNAASNLVQGVGSGTGGTKGKALQDARNLAFFSEQVAKIQKLREEKGDAWAQIKERELAANFAATGQEFNDDYKAVYETQTGQPWKYYGRDLETRIQQDYLFEDDLFKSGMVASYALPESNDMSEQERLQWASQYVAEQKAADVLLQRNMKNGQLQWSTGTKAAYETKREAVVGTTWGLLSQAVASGQVVSQEDFVQARTAWDSFKTSVPRPEGVTDEQWKEEQSSRDLIDSAFANMEKVVGSTELTKRVVEGMQRAGLEAGVNPLAIAAAGQDLSAIVASSTDLVADFIALGKVSPVNINMSDVYSTGKVGTGEVLTQPELPPSLREIAESKSPEEIWNAANGASILTRGTPADLGRETFKKQFVDSSMVLGASMMHNLDDEHMSLDFIRSSLGNPEFIANIQRLNAIDPAAAGGVRAVLQAGISSEIVRQNAALSSMEWQYTVKWNGSRYEFDEEAFKAKKPNASASELASTRNLVNSTWAGEAYSQPAFVSEAMGMRQAVSALEKAVIGINKGVVTDTSTIDTSNSIINPASTTATLLDKYEGGGDYDTLFKHSNKAGGPFENIKVSEMTIGELKAFANGSYGAWSVKQLGYKATPMGRFQFVGTTLASTAAKMGLGDNVVFTPDVQNKMFLFLANEVISGKSQEGKRAAIRSTWEGLKKASNNELDQMIAEIEGGNVAFGPGMTSGGFFSGGEGPLTIDTPDLTPPPSSGGVFQTSRTGSQSATEAPSSGAGVTLPEDVVRQSTATPVTSQTVVPEEVSNLVRSMVDRGVSEEIVLEEIERYLDERKKR